MNKYLKQDFKDLIAKFKAITMYASEYDPSEYLKLLKELNDEIKIEIEVIESDINIKL